MSLSMHPSTRLEYTVRFQALGELLFPVFFILKAMERSSILDEATELQTR